MNTTWRVRVEREVLEVGYITVEAASEDAALEAAADVIADTRPADWRASEFEYGPALVTDAEPR
jgi:hypothetical protein